jgi:glycosyltransferase involved in cell wall biosynthesis
MTTAISYSFVKKSTKVFGMQVAILDFLRAYLRYSRQEKIPFLYIHDNSRREIEQIAAEVGCDLSRLVFHQAPFSAETLNLYDTIFRIDPMPGRLLLDRPSGGSAFCGLAHAIAGYDAGKILELYCLHPSALGDAILCPSRAVAAAIRKFWDLYEGTLKAKFGVGYRCPVELPVLPLGVDVQRFEKIAAPDKRASQRATLGVTDNDIVILWVGRLSAAVKAHPLAMFRAVEGAARRTGRNIHFVMNGYFAPAEAEAEFRALARDFCPTAIVRFVESGHPAFPDGVWAAGDIFLSLIDNVQESFGLTPIEAIAAGLPRVASDWDGYRDSFKDGIDGFLVPTRMPPQAQGGDLAALALPGGETYAEQMQKTALCVAIDTEVATDRLSRLIENADLRRQMAEAAKKRLTAYDWKNLVSAYEDLWDDLARRKGRTNSRSVS